jgi:hypothetical protein
MSQLGSKKSAIDRYQDPVIEAYKRDVDRTLLRANLQLTVGERFEQFDNFAEFAKEIYESGVRARAPKKSDAPQ